MGLDLDDPRHWHSPRSAARRLVRTVPDVLDEIGARLALGDFVAILVDVRPGIGEVADPETVIATTLVQGTRSAVLDRHRQAKPPCSPVSHDLLGRIEDLRANRT